MGKTNIGKLIGIGDPSGKLASNAGKLLNTKKDNPKKLYKKMPLVKNLFNKKKAFAAKIATKKVDNTTATIKPLGKPEIENNFTAKRPQIQLITATQIASFKFNFKISTKFLPCFCIVKYAFLHDKSFLPKRQIQHI